MNLFSRILLFFTVAFLLIWQLPWCYAFFATKAAPARFVLYSSLLDDFIVTEHDKDKGILRHDLAGNRYTAEEVDSLLPAFFMRQLVADERFPDSILGIPVSPKEIQMTSFTFRAQASAVNTPQAGIYFLMESMPGRVDLEMPDDAFRFSRERIEFIDMETNAVNEEKSGKFTQMLSNKGFSFPPKEVSGNPTTMKEYDNGYLLLDAKGNLFHLKRTKGLPYVKALPVPGGITVAHVFITEFRDRKMLGFFTDTNHKLYAIKADGSIAPTGVPAYDPERDELTVIGNKFDWTVKVSSPRKTAYYGIKSSDFSLLKQYEASSGDGEIPGLSFTSPYDKYVRPRL